jgi:hypothetical protein
MTSAMTLVKTELHKFVKKKQNPHNEDFAFFKVRWLNYLKLSLSIKRLIASALVESWT